MALENKAARGRDGNSRALSGGTSYLSAEGSEQRATMLYTGAMEKGQMHGKGALVYPNSEKYEVRGGGVCGRSTWLRSGDGGSRSEPTCVRLAFAG